MVSSVAVTDFAKRLAVTRPVFATFATPFCDFIEQSFVRRRGERRLTCDLFGR